MRLSTGAGLYTVVWCYKRPTVAAYKQLQQIIAAREIRTYHQLNFSFCRWLKFANGFGSQRLFGNRLPVFFLCGRKLLFKIGNLQLGGPSLGAVGECSIGGTGGGAHTTHTRATAAATAAAGGAAGASSKRDARGRASGLYKRRDSGVP